MLEKLATCLIFLETFEYLILTGEQEGENHSTGISVCPSKKEVKHLYLLLLVN